MRRWIWGLFSPNLDAKLAFSVVRSQAGVRQSIL